MPDQQFAYSTGAMRFRDLTTGRWISEREVRDAVDRVADLASRRMGDIAARYRTGQIDTAAWITESQRVIKDSQIASALAAYGGRQQMTPQTWGATGAEIKRQYLYLNRMADDVLSGRQPMNGRLDARARQYGQSARATYENSRRRVANAAPALYFERNHLHASESCDQCRSQSARGPVPIGSLVPVGQRSCRSSCRCTISYSQSMSEAA